jgi:2,3-bisphosphoglycerate-independent phosphoglycerate mutase
MEAAITAVETVDTCVGRLLNTIETLGGTAIVTADHGNADEMFTEKNGIRTPKTSHTLNPVPFIIYDPAYKNEYVIRDLKNPGLTNVASTIVNLLGYDKIEDYDESLIKFC